MDTRVIKNRIVVSALRLNPKKCNDFLGLWVYAHKVNEMLELNLTDDDLTECAKHVQRCLNLPDVA